LWPFLTLLIFSPVEFSVELQTENHAHDLTLVWCILGAFSVVAILFISNEKFLEPLEVDV
jgi:hypothetical protein